MRRIVSNRAVVTLATAFTAAGAFVARGNPFGDGTIPWIGAVLISVLANGFLAFVIAPWAAPYLASTGGKQGAATANPQSVRNVERGVTAVLLSVALIATIAVELSSRGLVVTPTERLEKIAEIVKTNVEVQAPAKYRRQLGAADTWKMSDRAYRTCVPSTDDEITAWCVFVRVEKPEAKDEGLRLVKAGEGLNNARQFLKWHPEAAADRAKS